jgi:hypothetical protein
MVEMRGVYRILTAKCASEIFSPEVRIDAKFWIRAGCITFVRLRLHNRFLNGLRLQNRFVHWSRIALSTN